MIAKFLTAIGAVNEQLGDADWIRVTPYGEFPNKVGLQVVDRKSADEMASALNTEATRVGKSWKGYPIYEGHPDDPDWAKLNPTVKRMAQGRCKELQPRDDGLWGRVAFNDSGTPLVRGEAPAYTAQSPHWDMEPITHKGRKAFRPVILKSLGLTNTPNIPGTELGLNERTADEISPTMKTKIIALLAALGRPLANAESATDEQFAAAINEATPVATSALAAVNEVALLKPKLTTAENEAGSLRTQLATANSNLSAEKQNATNERVARRDLILTAAVNEGRITPADRATWQGKFDAATAVNDFTTLATDLGKLKPASNTRSHVENLGLRKAEGLENKTKITAINEAVSKYIKDHGLHPQTDYHRAYVATKAAQPALFENSPAAS